MYVEYLGIWPIIAKIEEKKIRDRYRCPRIDLKYLKIE